jgi:hypothetical protein
MARQQLVLNNFSGGVNNVKDSRDINDNECAKAVNVMFDKQGAIRTAGSFDTHVTSNLSGDSSDNQPGNGLFYFESDYGSKEVTGTTTDNGAGVFGYIYDAPDNEIRQSSNPIQDYFEVGDKISVSGTASNNGIYTIIGKHTYGFSGHQKYAWEVLEPLQTETVATAMTIKSYNQFGVDFWMKPRDSDGSTAANLEISLHDSENNSWSHAADIQPIIHDDYIASTFQPVYYSIDNAVRISDSNFKNAAKIKWYGYIERNHPDQDYHGWYTKDNDLLAPTAGDDVRIFVSGGHTYPDTAGVGLHWEVLTPADASSKWDAETYETAMTFIYDENQESKITEMQSSYVEFTVDTGDSVTIQADLFTPYNPRITASRLYCRVSGSDDSWTLLAEVHFSKGIRSNLDDEYTSGFTAESTPNQYHSAIVTSLRENLDTYETINGRAPSVKSVSLGKIGELWKCAVVCNRRTFLANVKIANEDAEISDSKHYGDRILYSEINKFDTFPSYNFIDVVKGDSEEYISLVEYGDRLLAFKQKTLFIVNVASPQASGWFLEKTLRYNGVRHKEAVFRTEDGVVWVNESGCWFYNGSEVINLVENKLDTVNATNSLTDGGLSWKDFYNYNSIVGYSPKYKQIIILQDCDGSTDPMNALIYDFRTKSWVQNSDQTTFFNNVVYSNFVLDGDGDLSIMTTGGVLRYYNPVSSTSTSGIEIITKFIDFGAPYKIKKVYKVAISYKSNTSQVDPIEVRYISRTGAMQSFADLDGSVDFAAKTEWDVITFTAGTPIECQALQIKINPPSAGTIDINEIMIDYRVLNKLVI